METIILASSSPRRKEIFDSLHIPYLTIEPDVDEDRYQTLPASKRVMRLAADKVKNAALKMNGSGSRWIAGFDTLIGYHAKTIGKPGNREEAARMLAAFSGRAHNVYTGVALASPDSDEILTRFGKTRVTFARMSGAEIEFYLDSGEWQGVAGAYRIQEQGAYFIKQIHGSPSNVVGLPISLFYDMLRCTQYPFS